VSEPGEGLFDRFVRHGFEGLTDEEPGILAQWLRESASRTGRAGPVFISEAIDATYALFLTHDKYGGIRFGFIRELDEIVYSSLPAIQKAEVHWEAKLAKDFRDKVLAMVGGYDPQKEYE
jgi:hypothetical protein